MHTSTFLDCVSVRDDSQGLVETCMPHVLRDLLPMNPAVDGFRLVVRRTHLARPEAPLKVTVSGHGLTPNRSAYPTIPASGKPWRRTCVRAVSSNRIGLSGTHPAVRRNTPEDRSFPRIRW